VSELAAGALGQPLERQAAGAGTRGVRTPTEQGEEAGRERPVGSGRRHSHGLSGGGHMRKIVHHELGEPTRVLRLDLPAHRVPRSRRPRSAGRQGVV
jgi:hypothetical protein